MNTSQWSCWITCMLLGAVCLFCNNTQGVLIFVAASFVILSNSEKEKAK